MEKAGGVMETGGQAETGGKGSGDKSSLVSFGTAFLFVFFASGLRSQEKNGMKGFQTERRGEFSGCREADESFQA